MRRRLVLILLLLAAGLVVFVATVPLWLGVALKLAGPSRGLTFARYERIGYTRFALHDVAFRRPGLAVTASRVEAETPVVWWWHRSQKSAANVSVGDWRVVVEKTDAPSKPATGDRGWIPLRRQLQRIASTLDQWLPRAATGAGVVRWPTGEIGVRAAKWARKNLTLEGVQFRTLAADAMVDFSGDDQIDVALRLNDDLADARLRSRGLEVSGSVALWRQVATLNATYAPKGWLPNEASLYGADWNIPGERLKLGDVYSAVRGSARVQWRTEHFVADITATSDPLPGKAAPPLVIALRGNGSTEAFTIESLKTSLPGINALLNEPVTIERTGKIRQSSARFTFDADLAKVPWFAAKGNVKGDARLVSGLAASPVAEFSFDARDVSARDVALSAVAAKGRLDWPRIEIAEGSMTATAGERLTWRGGYDFKAKEILPALVEGEIRRESLARWLPKQPEFETIKIKAEASGALASVKHSGSLSAAGVKVEGLNPLAIGANWNGASATIEQFSVEAAANGSKVQVAGSVDATGLTCKALDFVEGGNTRLKLVAPAVVRWKPTLQLEGIKLTGPDASLTAVAAMGENGRIEIAAHNIASKWFHDLLQKPGPSVTLTLLALVGTWQHGPMNFTLTAGAGLEIGEGRTAAVNVTAKGDKSGVHIEALRATEADDTVVNATGRIPVTFTPGAKTLVNMDANGSLVLDASVAPNAAFWQKLAVVSGIELKDPHASAHLKGTWQRPEGNLTLQAARIAADPKRFTRPLPAVDALDIEVTGDRSGVTLSKCTVSVEGQEVRAQGRLPVPEGEWGKLFKEPLGTAQRGADLRVEVPDAEVAVFTRFLPAVLAPKGRLQADVHYKSGGLEGFLRLRDAASKPLGPLGVLQEISADVAMSGRKFALRGVTAKSGGQPVTLSGTVELPENGVPKLDLALRGENLPFVRQTGLLLRGDLDLKLQTPENAQPRLSGNVRLRDSLFLSDVRAFLPKGGASAQRRPPYFAVETPPVNAWTLAVDVVGEQFMRLRMPVFTGIATARFRLGGTLGEPRAIGEITIDQGSVRMPFASFAVTQGSIRLTEADPYEPAVYLRGTGRRYGYDLTMEIDGTASQPNVVFMSSPPLDSEQVLLMVMTGAAPSNEISKSATQRVANIGLFLSQSLLGSLGSDAAEADRLSFASGEKISRQGKETYDIEYKLSDRWTLTGEYNEFDEYNAGIKWRALRGKRPGQTNDDAKK